MDTFWTLKRAQSQKFESQNNYRTFIVLDEELVNFDNLCIQKYKSTWQNKKKRMASYISIILSISCMRL